MHGCLMMSELSFETSPPLFCFRGCFNHLCPPKNIVRNRLASLILMARAPGLQDEIHEILWFSGFVCSDGVDRHFSRKDESKKCTNLFAGSCFFKTFRMV